MIFSRAIASPRGRLRTLADLTRIGTIVAGACLTLVGAHLAVGAVDVARVTWATACVALLIAFAQVVNDIIDVEVDRLQQRSRPLVRGEVTTRFAAVMAVTLGGAGLLAALVAGPPLSYVAIAILLASWAYSAWWKGTIGFGNVVVALLASAPVAFGAAAAGDVDGLAWAAQGVVFVFMAAFEVIKTGRDVEGDNAAGLMTLATRFGLHATYRIAGALCLAFVAVSVVPALMSDNWIAYVVVMAPAVVLTGFAAWKLLNSDGRSADLAPALALVRAAWFPGIAALVLLRRVEWS